MLLSAINPFIRFAQPITIECIDSHTISYDSRLFYVLSGTCTLSISDKDYQLKPGTLLLWKSAIPYKFSINSNISLISINFDYTQENMQKKDSISPVLQEDFEEKKLLEKIYFSDFNILNTPIILHNMQHFETKIDLIVNEFSRKKLGYDVVCSAVLKELIVESARIALIDIPENSWKIEKAVQYIEQHYNHEISNAELAAIVGYHPYHLNRLMKSTTGMTLHQYMLNVRIEKSKSALLNTNMSIAEIAELCGFKNSYHFSNTFKSKTGLTPTSFRHNRKSIL